MLSDKTVVMGKRALVCSNAKINLTLDVTDKRPDGYHNVKMIMQTVSLFDLVIVDKARRNISVSTNLAYVPDNEQNIAYKAAKAFFRYAGIFCGCKILIRKNIPIAAGLAGGSGNAAAVLCALNKLYNTGFSDEQLCEVGVSVGADVPFCILGGTMLAEGVGEKLSSLPPLPNYPIVIVKPSNGVSTSEIYAAIDSAEELKHPDTDTVIAALENGDIRAVAENMSNIMESITAAKFPEIYEVRAGMLKYGALGSVMSGSGPSVFGIFPDYYSAKKAHDFFTREHKSAYVVSAV